MLPALPVRWGQREIMETPVLSALPVKEGPWGCGVNLEFKGCRVRRVCQVLPALPDYAVPRVAMQTFRLGWLKRDQPSV